MSAFKRTTSGINSQHLFYNVDLIAFLEGGTTSYSKTDAYADMYNPETDDIVFWSKVFGLFLKEKKIKFKSIGSKTIVKEIASDVINGNLNTVIVAMDNEFDEVLKTRINHSHVFYTNGYSWENDVWNTKVIELVIEELTAIKSKTHDISNNFSLFLKKIKIGVNADSYQFKRGMSFFPRKSGYLFCVECNPVDLPYVKDSEIKTKLAAYGLNRDTVNRYGRRHAIEPNKFCYGHLLADYCCQLISHYIKKRHSLTTISKSIIYRIGINKAFQVSFTQGQIFEHYQIQFNRLRSLILPS